MLAGRENQLPAEGVLTSGIEILGFGNPNTPETRNNVAEGTAKISEMIIQGNLSMETVRMSLRDIERAWNMEEHGKRLVFVP